MAVATMPRRQIYVRPRSELITVLNWRQVSDIGTEKWRSETCLDANFFEDEERPENTRYVCGSYELTRGHLEESEDEMTKAKEIDIPDTKMASKRSELTINLQPTSVKVKPRLVKAQSMANLPINSSGLDRGYTRSNNSVPTKLNPKRKSSLDVSLAKLRYEMVGTYLLSFLLFFLHWLTSKSSTILFLCNMITMVYSGKILHLSERGA